MCVFERERESYSTKMKSLDPFDSLSFPSEPPDIGNWFSSYVYESPVLDSNDGFENTEFRKEDFGDEEIYCENEENLCDFRKSGNENESHSPLDGDGFLIEGKIKGIESMVKDRQCLKREKDLTVMYNLSFEPILERYDEEKASKKHEYSSRQDSQKTYFAADECYVGNLLNKKSSAEPELMPHKAKYLTLTGARSQERSLHGVKIVKESVRVNSVRSPETKTDKENTPKKSPGNGFISTRKNKSSKEYDGNYIKMSQVGSLKIAKTSASIVKRKALSDIINIQSTDAALEIAGKWMCPQKSKPDLGPPMKQLGLEQWVRRQA